MRLLGYYHIRFPRRLAILVLVFSVAHQGRHCPLNLPISFTMLPSLSVVHVAQFTCCSLHAFLCCRCLSLAPAPRSRSPAPQRKFAAAGVPVCECVSEVVLGSMSGGWPTHTACFSEASVLGSCCILPSCHLLLLLPWLVSARPLAYLHFCCWLIGRRPHSGRVLESAAPRKEQPESQTQTPTPTFSLCDKWKLENSTK